MHAVIFLRPQAPDKPELGAACNGCGVCCTTAPCPLGIVVSRRRRGICAALTWSDDNGIYRCGLIEQPTAYLPRWLRGLGPSVARLARRYIAAGVGCDCDIEAQRGDEAAP